ACARELKKRFEQLRVLHLAHGKIFPSRRGQVEKEIPVAGFAVSYRGLRDHIDGFVILIALALGGTDLHAKRAAGAVFRSDLQGVSLVAEALPSRWSGEERRRRTFEQIAFVQLRPDYGMWANQNAFTALDAEFLVPCRDLQGDVALFPLGSSAGICAVDR